MTIPGVALTGVQKKTITDRVQLPRLYLAWLTPRHFEPGDAALDVVADVLAGGKNSRLYKRLVYDMQIAQNVSAYSELAGAVVVLPDRSDAAAGTHRRGTAEGDRRGDREAAAASRRRITKCSARLNQIEASFYNRMERVGGFGGKADQLNAYYTNTGDPDWFNEDLARYRALSPSDIRAAADTFLPAGRRVELTVVPEAEATKAEHTKRGCVTFESS